MALEQTPPPTPIRENWIDTPFGRFWLREDIYRKWRSLGGAQGRLGYPIGDAFEFLAVYDTEMSMAASFERGMIVARHDLGGIFFVAGRINLRYQQLGGLGGQLGLPRADQEDVPQPADVDPADIQVAERCSFDKGDIYYRADLGAFAVRGTHLSHWLDLGGANGVLGYPISDSTTSTPFTGSDRLVVITRFEIGAIYYTQATGTCEVTGDIYQCYESTELGGPTGVLGLPVCGERATPRPGGRFNDFERGCVVQLPGQKVRPVVGLALHLDRVQARGSGFVGGRDLYIRVDAEASKREMHGDVAGVAIIEEFHQRMPGDGDWGEHHKFDPPFTLLSVPAVSSGLRFSGKIEGWDSTTFGGDDLLGTYRIDYSIDNAWGLDETSPPQWKGDFLAVFSTNSGLPVDQTKVRQQLFWSFHNWNTPTLTTDQFAQTYSDAQEDERVLAHPFNELFYNLLYKGCAEEGNCFGMCLESAYARANRSLFDEPVFHYPFSDRIANEINVKHGYQFGDRSVAWFLAKAIRGLTHSSTDTFAESRGAYLQGDWPVIALTPAELTTRGHVVLPYDWHYKDPDKWIISVANPNNPAPGEPDGGLHSKIEINPSLGSWTFNVQGSEEWHGVGRSGGRMWSIPFHILSSQPSTPFWQFLELLAAGVLVILGGDGSTRQVTDDKGRTLYDPNITGPPTLWEHIREPGDGGIPNLVRLPDLRMRTLSMPHSEAHYFEGEMVASLRHDVIGSGDPYVWGFRSRMMSAKIETNASATGASDAIALEGLGSYEHAVSLQMPEAGEVRQASFTLAGWTNDSTIRPRQFVLRAVDLQPNHLFRIGLREAGQSLRVENLGPDTSFQLQMSNPAGTTMERPVQIRLRQNEIAHYR